MLKVAVSTSASASPAASEYSPSSNRDASNKRGEIEVHAYIHMYLFYTYIVLFGACISTIDGDGFVRYQGKLPSLRVAKECRHLYWPGPGAHDELPLYVYTHY